MMPAANRVVEIVVAVERHATPAELIVRYMITHGYSRHHRTERLADPAEIALDGIEYKDEYYHLDRAPTLIVGGENRTGPGTVPSAA
jgi:hypothetical protein